MPLFGFRTHKKYDKDFSQEKQVKAAPDKIEKKTKPRKETIKAEKLPAPKVAVAKTKISAAAIVPGAHSSSAEAIIRPRITEKSGLLSQNGAYTFQVTESANKQTITKAIVDLYKIRPVKVAVMNIPAKSVFVRGKIGRVPGMKKAVVTLKKGDKIDFV
ncbi:50S ribosomal protein L23 [Patescibacteria group bacterium]|nr:50S ribosomal protein L23 [Patescibacteria group bacterium]MDE1946849.1 50S ribosomal protein L23 [Patescibacteria group bacterium]MDE2010669.1 50S ribosomal protein L23 [Patescibacteria group bacterium]MDE2232725.1 50S ribosomal protein L23 [Patescibacteria group bacterium]